MQKKENSSVTRRKFIQTTGVAASLVAVPAFIPRSAFGANDKLTCAFIGFGAIVEKYLLKAVYANQDAVDIAAVCDVYHSRARSGAAQIKARTGREVKVFQDYRHVLDMPDVDYVIVATPDHWHAIITIQACMAGKDVYCEKIPTHNINEGQAMLRAMDKYNRIVQVGSMSRSATHIQEMRAFIQSGKLGRIYETVTNDHQNITPKGWLNDEITEVPKELNWDMWVGPGPMIPFRKQLVHGKWRFLWDFGNGAMDFNIHMQDITMWCMGSEDPISVSAVGDRYALEDQSDIFDTQEALFRFPATKTNPEYIHRFNLRLGSAHGKDKWMEFFGNNGYCATHPGKGFKVIGDPVNRRFPNGDKRIEDYKTKGSIYRYYNPHMTNFIESVKSRKEPIASLRSVNHTANCCHLANIAAKVGRTLYWNAEDAKCYQDQALKKKDKEANKLLDREYRKGYELPKV